MKITNQNPEVFKRFASKFLFLLFSFRFCSSICRHIVRQTSQVHRNIDCYHLYFFGNYYMARRKIQDTSYPYLNQRVSCLLSRVSGYCNNCKVDFTFFQHLYIRDVFNPYIIDFPADYFRIDIESSGNVKTIYSKACK